MSERGYCRLVVENKKKRVEISLLVYASEQGYRHSAKHQKKKKKNRKGSM